jgi:putative hemolysin
MTILYIVVFVVLAAVETLASYVNRVYSEFGKILSREDQDNVRIWEEKVEPRLGLGRDHAAICAAVLQQLAFGLIVLEVGAILFEHVPKGGQPTIAEGAQALIAVVLVLAFCGQLFPALLFNRTRGQWAVRLIWPVRIMLWTVTPISAFVRFFFSVAALAEEPDGDEEEPTPSVEALLEVGEEEGILEQSDRDLVRSAVEFGDMLVREIMTPRPAVFAVPVNTTLEHFLELLREHNFSRVPVYAGTLDNITGLAFAHDLLQISDTDAHTQTVANIQRPAVFVPETKRGYELLREMQREKQHMRIVIDEYGGVAGLVTIEDLLEQIVGNIRDEHEVDIAIEEPQREAGGSWLLPGNFPADQLSDLFGESVPLPENYEATTIAGLVSEIEGRIPHAGEVIMLEPSGVRVEIVVSTDRRIDRLRVFAPPEPEAEEN